MEDFANSIFAILLYAVLILLPGCAFSFLLHYLLSLPMQRRDRARFFLDMLETALERGQNVEQAILSAAASHDPVMGVRFHLLAAHIEDDHRFGEALQRVPRFLPPQVNAMLHAGETLGDLRKVLPACREVLRVASDTVRTTANYMVAILMLFAPISIWLISLLSIFVMPKFKDVAAGSGAPLWPISIFTFVSVPYLIYFEAILFFILVAVLILFIGGPGFLRWSWFPGVQFVNWFMDWFAWQVPWKRKKLLRSFSAMLAVLLDGGVPEADAVRLAGECTANEICIQRARKVSDALCRGEKLDEAVRAFDDSGEFHWRLTNATHSRGGFLAALHGWHEALDAKAFQQEETATHILTSGLVILNGVVVAIIATGMFAVLIAILRNGLDNS